MTAIYPPLEPLINQARQEGKWLYCSYQNIWFSPDDLEKENKNGQFRWEPVNFTLRNPQEMLEQKKRELRCVEKDYINALEKVEGKLTLLQWVKKST